MPCNDCSRAETCPPCVNEPPPTSEEEEEAGCNHWSWDVTSEWYDRLSQKWHKSRRCNECSESLDVIFEDDPHFPENEGKGAPPKLPQPERRPPYAVAYSVGGHAYEIALPGDATVRAVDGALIITHSLGPVVGIVQTRPLEGEQSA